MSEEPSDKKAGTSVPPPKRTYSERGPRAKDIDSQARLNTFAGWFMGGGVGGIFGMLLGAILFGSAALGFVIGVAIGALLGHLGVQAVLGGSSRALSGTLLPSGGSTAYKTQYSDAEACAMRSDYPAAIATYQRYVDDEPLDPEPYVRIARLYRDQIKDYENAVTWFKRARNEAQLDRGRELLAMQEIIELYIHKLRAPRKAIPELARLCERFPDTPAAQAAQAELEQLREMLALEQAGEGPLTGRYYKDRRETEQD